MSRAPRKSAKVTDTPALVDTPSPKPAVETTAAGLVDPIVAGGVVSADAATAPSVPDNVPLPPDQMSVAQRPVAIDGAASIHRDPDVAERAEPLDSIVPEHRSIDELTPPTEPVAAIGEPMERVPGTVPLPSDQITPGARAAAPLGDYVDPAVVEAIGSGFAATRDPLRKLFPVAFEVEHDSQRYLPGGVPVALTFDEWERLNRATAVLVDWLDGEEASA